MTRRQVVQGMGGVGLALVAGCGLGPFQPQQSPTTARLGFLGPTSPQPYYAAITQGLYDLGYVEGRNLHIEYRYAEGNTERLPELAADLVRLNADIILAAGNPAIQSAKQATRAIPIVMAIANSDPVTAGLGRVRRKPASYDTVRVPTKGPGGE